MASSLTVDLSSFVESRGQAKELLAQFAVNVLKNHGYIKLKNHGICPDGMRHFWNWEHFDCGSSHDTEFPNRWPDLPGFREYMEAHYERCQEVALGVLSMVELGLGLEADTLVALCKPATSELRILHYPSAELPVVPPTYKRIWPHCDLGVLSILLQGGVDGLEFEDRKCPGSYLPAVFDTEDEVLVTVSETLARWTNGVLAGGRHQVTLPTNMVDGILPERYASAFFFKSCRSASIGPLPAFVTEDNPAKYENMTALEFHLSITKELEK
ncbi:uncharacterized protein BCR38DRAFT_350467 [Pseudomassariella vexata]|uniref:Fe2OG dioxygenase domain-containing protein n=1 Tax=Pseudomassariella vexata TaxID=1141098 RepID=A0A1Y2DLV2_9PEZI|nr:uncharacterized protein BCR38DRAFT_350467 [Pseudomassariella vexata]ORY60116.1 hypothetical protein BCR38DRAFT_350467 [Pseudomassariella vexata]